MTLVYNPAGLSSRCGTYRVKEGIEILAINGDGWDIDAYRIEIFSYSTNTWRTGMTGTFNSPTGSRGLALSFRNSIFLIGGNSFYFNLEPLIILSIFFLILQVQLQQIRPAIHLNSVPLLMAGFRGQRI
jgi:hypothetical protein